MPTYDLECSACNHSSTTVLKIAQLSSWDLAAICPQCQAGNSSFRRVIRHAPTLGGTQGVKGQLASQKERFIRSGERDAMRHNASKRVDRDQAAAGIESVRRGEFEGF